AKLPQGALQTRTDFGTPGYGGPCPPPGDHPHRYLFTVFAVAVERLQVTADTAAAGIRFQLRFNTLAKAAIMGLCKRSADGAYGRRSPWWARPCEGFVPRRFRRSLRQPCKAGGCQLGERKATTVTRAV